MSQGGDSQQRRKNANAGPDPLPLTGQKTRAVTGPQTNIHQADDEDSILDEHERSSTSIVRYSTQQRFPSPPTTPTTPATPINTRRSTGTRDLPLPDRQPTRSLPSTARQQSRNTTTQYAPSTGSAAPKGKKRNSTAHWLLPLGVGMVAMLVLWIFGSLLVVWGQQRYEDITYGRPRTSQTDAIVGHNDSPAHKSHFIAINYNRQAIVTEWMGGDPAKSVVYVVPYYIVGDNSELTPVTVELRDVTGDHKPDLIIHIHLHSQDQTFVFVNDGAKFRPPLATDKITM